MTTTDTPTPFAMLDSKPATVTTKTLQVLAHLYGDTTTDRPAVAYVVVWSRSESTDLDTILRFLPTPSLVAQPNSDYKVWIAVVDRGWGEWTLDRFASGCIAAKLAIGIDGAIDLAGEAIFDLL